MDRQEFERVKRKGTGWRALGNALGLVVGLPVLLYWLIEHTLQVDTGGQWVLAAALAALGMVALAAYWSYR
jgi:hypothetical protein